MKEFILNNILADVSTSTFKFGSIDPEHGLKGSAMFTAIHANDVMMI